MHDFRDHMRTGISILTSAADINDSPFLIRMQTHMEYQLDQGKSWLRIQWDQVTTFLEENRQHIFYLCVFFAINVWLFVERFIRKYSSWYMGTLGKGLCCLGCWPLMAWLVASSWAHVYGLSSNSHSLIGLTKLKWSWLKWG